MKKQDPRPNWHTWQNGDEIVMQATELSQGQGALVYRPDGTVQAMFAEAAQIRRDCPSATEDNPSNRRANVRLDRDFELVVRLMRLREQGIDFETLASDSNSDKSNRFLVNCLSGDAWELLAAVASGDHLKLEKLARSINQYRELNSEIQGGRVKQLYEVAGSLARCAEKKWKLTNEVTPPTKAEVQRQLREDRHGALDTTKPPDLRERLWHMGFAWLEGMRKVDKENR